MSASLSSMLFFLVMLLGVSTAFVISFFRPNVTAPMKSGAMKELISPSIFPSSVVGVFIMLACPANTIQWQLIASSSGMRRTALTMVALCFCGLRCFGVNK